MKQPPDRSDIVFAAVVAILVIVFVAYAMTAGQGSMDWCKRAGLDWRWLSHNGVYCVDTDGRLILPGPRR